VYGYVYVDVQVYGYVNVCVKVGGDVSRFAVNGAV